jgi:hypothetical protein
MSFGISLWLPCYRPKEAAVLHTHIYCTDCGPIAWWLRFPYHAADQTRILYIYTAFTDYGEQQRNMVVLPTAPKRAHGMAAQRKQPMYDSMNPLVQIELPSLPVQSDPPIKKLPPPLQINNK